MFKLAEMSGKQEVGGECFLAPCALDFSQNKHRKYLLRFTDQRIKVLLDKITKPISMYSNIFCCCITSFNNSTHIT